MPMWAVGQIGYPSLSISFKFSLSLSLSIYIYISLSVSRSLTQPSALLLWTSGRAAE